MVGFPELLKAGVPLLCGLGWVTPAKSQTPLSVQIAAATVPLPASLRSGAGVVVLGPSGTPKTLRSSTNDIICISDPPGDAWFDVECYQAGFIPVVYRLAELKAAGLSETEMDRKIESEIRLGRLKLLPHPMMNYQMIGPIAGYDSITNTVSSAITRMQRLFIPWSTAEASGVPEGKETVYPWIMSAGTYYAHLMILPSAGPAPQPLPQ